VIERAFERMEKLEDPIEEAMLGWLNSRDDLRVLGVTSAGQERHPTFSIVHRSMASDEIERRVNLEGSCGVKGGHFYAWRACEAVGIAPEPGVVRVSAVHTNTVDEVMRVCGILERALG
jgi:selenocysteine lyase/cysteine desulfurase